METVESKLSRFRPWLLASAILYVVTGVVIGSVPWVLGGAVLALLMLACGPIVQVAVCTHSHNFIPPSQPLPSDVNVHHHVHHDDPSESWKSGE